MKKKSSDDADISLEMKRYGKQIEQIDDSVFRPNGIPTNKNPSETDDQMM
ncbi:MAG: hypothetical protein ACLR7D_09440 [Lachnospira eligens]